MKEISKWVIIQALPERVWQVLTDFASYPQWLPDAPQISGALEQGQCLQIASGLPAPHASTACTLLLRRAEPPYALYWTLHNSPGLQSGERRFVIEPLGQNQALFTQAEVFGGLFASTLACLLYSSTRRIFEQMNQAIKARAEQPDNQSFVEAGTVWPPPPIRML